MDHHTKPLAPVNLSEGAARDNSHYPKAADRATFSVSKARKQGLVRAGIVNNPVTIDLGVTPISVSADDLKSAMATRSEASDEDPLGNIAIKQSTRPETGFREEASDGDEVKNVNGGLVRDFEADRRQWERWALQSVARDLLKGDKRLSKCCRWLLGGYAQVIQASSGACSYGGVETCGSVWRCAVCAAKIAHRRKLELSELVKAHAEQGGSVALVTRTFPHTSWDLLEPMLERFRKAEMNFKGGRGFQGLRDMVGLVGTVRALEVTHGANGFHPHGHELWLISADDWREDRDFRVDVQDMARLLWGRVCERAGLPLPGHNVGLTIQGGRRAAEYVAKFGDESGSTLASSGRSWGIEDELTKAHIKRGKQKGRTPWDLLRLVLEHDDQAAADLFREYAAAFYRKRQLWWSKGLRDHFDMGDESTDEDLAAETAQGALLGEVEFSDWRLVVRADAQFALLQAAQDRGWPGVVDFLEGLRNG